MRYVKLLAATVVCLIVPGFNYQPSHGNNRSLHGGHSLSALERTLPLNNTAAERYRLDPSQSKFIAHALSGGLLWFKGHNHLIAIREFTGEALFTPDSITGASLQFTAKAASMVETSSVFTEQEKQIINKELRDIVLHPDQYPDIVFRSTSVAGKSMGNNRYDLKITGDLTLHGVTRRITIPSHVTLMKNDLRAQGEFNIKRKDFNVKATSAMHGLIRVKDRVKFTFDIIGHN